MRSFSLAHAKSHISALVDDAEHHGKSAVIMRHGKPVAAIVPLAKAMPRRLPRLSDAQVLASVLGFISEFSEAQSDVSAVDDLLQGRR